MLRFQFVYYVQFFFFQFSYIYNVERVVHNRNSPLITICKLDLDHSLVRINIPFMASSSHSQIVSYFMQTVKKNWNDFFHSNYIVVASLASCFHLRNDDYCHHYSYTVSTDLTYWVRAMSSNLDFFFLFFLKQVSHHIEWIEITRIYCLLLLLLLL